MSEKQIQLSIVKSTEIEKSFKVDSDEHAMQTTITVSCDYFSKEDFLAAQPEIAALAAAIKSLIFAHRDHPHTLSETPPSTKECSGNPGIKSDRLTWYHMRRVVKEVLSETANFYGMAECPGLANRIVERISDEAASGGLEGRGQRVYLESQVPKPLSITFTYEDYGRPRVQGEPVGCIIVESRYPAVGSETHSGRSLICRDLIHIEHQSPLKDVEQLKEKIWQQARMIIDQLVSDS